MLDSFMGSGSTLAAAEAVGYESIGIEIDADYFALAKEAIPQLAALYPTFQGEETVLDVDYTQPRVSEDQLALALAERPEPAAASGRRPK
jgi:tRNA G10  N-methylase Trm11